MFKNPIFIAIFLGILLLISPSIESITAANEVPIIGALVFAESPAGSGSTMTIASGQYIIDKGLKTGSYEITASAEGYITKNISGISIQEVSETPNVNFLLRRSGAISGKITDAVTGQGINSVLISVFSEAKLGYIGITNTDGSYKIATNLDTGTYDVTVIQPSGYISKTIQGVSVTAGVETKNIDMTLAKSGTITGRITSSQGGQPLQNITVLATSTGGDGTGTAQTDALGNYKIQTGLGTGTYTVMAISGQSMKTIPNVSVTSGQETKNIDLTLTITSPPQSGTIKGKVTDASNSGIIGVHVTATGAAGSGSDVTDGEGNYEISNGLGTGTYSVAVSKQGFLDGIKPGISVTAGAITSGVDFTLQSAPPEKSGKISGTVMGEPNPLTRSKSIITCFVSTSTINSGESITVTGVISPAVSGASLTLSFKKDALNIPLTVTAGTDGKYSSVYTPPSAGTWSVTASWYGNTDYYPSISEPTQFTVAESQATGDLLIAVKDASGTFLAGAQVTSTEQPSGQNTLSGTTGQDGIITFNQLKPGNYKIQATKTDYLSNLGTMTVIEEKTATLAIVLQKQSSPTGKILVTVKDSSAQSISGATVLSTSQPAGQPAVSGTTASDGTISFNDVAPGDYTVQVSKNGFQTVTSSWKVVAGGETGINTILTPQSSSGGGIPGFPYEALIIGIILAVWITSYSMRKEGPQPLPLQ